MKEPIEGQKVYYKGNESEDWLPGKSYKVLEKGNHWSGGYVLWVTTEDKNSESDIDYCHAIGVEMFHSLFDM
jgi:hypothetical protein